MTVQRGKLAVLAGRGALPGAVLRSAVDGGRDVFVLAFEGETEPGLVEGFDHAWVKLGAVGKAISLLHRAAVEEVVMIGAVDRPSLTELRLDLRGMQLLARLGLNAARGDDRLLSVIVGELEREGFRVRGADEIIEAMLAPSGVMTACGPDQRAHLDIEVGLAAARRLGELDIGQAVVVQQGVVLALEAAEGTDGLLSRAGTLRREGVGGVLVKMKKPGQDRRTDLPTVGERTIEGVIDAGLRGIAVHAGHCLMVERRAMIERANAAGLFVIGVEGAQ